MAYIWNATSNNPTLFLVPYDDAVGLLQYIGDSVNSPSWVKKGKYSRQSPSMVLTEALSKYENNFEVLRPQEINED